MLKINVFDIKGEKKGLVSLPEEIFAAKINPQLEALAVRVYLANQRTAGAKTKTRAEVNRTKAKWYRQKHTGRARHGSRAANIFVGGGIVFGPDGEQNFKLKINQKMKQAALFSALTGKLKDKEILIVDGLEKVKPKTKEIIKVIKNLELRTKNSKAKILIVMPKPIDSIIRSARNIDGVSLDQADQLNTYLVLNHQQLVFMKESLEELKTHFISKK